MLKKLLLIALMIPLVVSAQTVATRHWVCSPPTTGSTPTAYQWETSDEGGPWAVYATTPAESLSVDAVANLTYRVRVRAIDALGHTGPWSVASLPDVYGAPGACGAPVVRP